MIKLIIAGVMALLLVGGGAFAWRRLRHQVDPTVAEPHVERDLTVEEIRSKLISGDFKARLEAGRQINKLEAEEKLRVLLRLSEEGEAATRILAAKKLKSVDDPRAREQLRKMSLDDPDPDVREMGAGTP